MKRVWRIISVLLFGLAIAAWGFSYVRFIQLKLPAHVGQMRYECLINRGLICAFVLPDFPYAEDGTMLVGAYRGGAFWDSAYRRGTHFGFGARSRLIPLDGRPGMNSMATRMEYSIPHWFVVAVSGAMAWPVIRRMFQRRRWRGRGVCLNCGYDLRTQLTMEGTRECADILCPECGDRSCLSDLGAHSAS